MAALDHPAVPALPALEDELRPPLTAPEAVAEADRCLECGGPFAEAPCVTACPAGVDVPGFVGAVAEGRPERAAQIVWAANIVGATCARVCPVEVLCQSACVLEREGRRPVAIGDLQRHATDWGLEHRVPLRPRVTLDGARVAVVGAGPAGLACAGELAARGHRVTVWDTRGEVGGLVRFAIAPYRQRRDPLPAELRALERLGVTFRLGSGVTGPDDLRRLEAVSAAIVLAVGMGPDADVAIPGDRLPGVWESLPFIEMLKTGRPPSLGRRVAVIGGGNTAIDVAVEAARLGAAEVTLVYRRTEAEMPAWPHEVELARAHGVRFLWLTAPVALAGRRRVERMDCLRMALGEPDESGRRRPVPVEGGELSLRVDTVVKAIGRSPRARLLSWVDGLEVAGGRIVVDPATGRTGNPLYYAAGDAVNGGTTVVEAVREAKAVAEAIDREARRAA